MQANLRDAEGRQALCRLRDKINPRSQPNPTRRRTSAREAGAVQGARDPAGRFPRSSSVPTACEDAESVGLHRDYRLRGAIPLAPSAGACVRWRRSDAEMQDEMGNRSSRLIGRCPELPRLQYARAMRTDRDGLEMAVAANQCIAMAKDEGLIAGKVEDTNTSQALPLGGSGTGALVWLSSYPPELQCWCDELDVGGDYRGLAQTIRRARRTNANCSLNPPPCAADVRAKG